ncbi:MAG: hypothetical protein ACK5JT_03255, partial [Hyphomicrobiaceae bacterium]
SAIVLSATLSIEARQRLATAFQRGLGCAPEPISQTHYPLLTVVSGGGAHSHPVATRAEIARDLSVARIATMSAVAEHIADKSRQGATAAWIRNTVDDAIGACEALRAHGIEPILLHARFAMGDRLDIEEDVQRRLGKASTLETRRNPDGSGVVVVGTQILEQSLDYDVDAMVMDLAPVDMIIQRAGRLWRHPARSGRPIAESERVLMVLSPDPSANKIGKDWYREVSPGAAAVYPDHGYVWLSARALFERGAIRTPDGIRDLLAAVYNDEPQADVPDGLTRASLDADGRRHAARSLAAANSLSVTEGYLGNNALFLEDTVTPTRLGEKSTVFRLAKRVGGRIVPWHSVEEAGSPARAWALSECAVRETKASGIPEPAGPLAAEIAAVKETWPKWEQ